MRSAQSCELCELNIPEQSQSENQPCGQPPSSDISHPLSTRHYNVKQFTVLPPRESQHDFFRFKYFRRWITSHLHANGQFKLKENGLRILAAASKEELESCKLFSSSRIFSSRRICSVIREGLHCTSSFGDHLILPSKFH